MYKTVTTDVLVIGAGGAGLRAAIEAAKKGLDVFLLAKEVLGCAHTGMAMGGLNAALRAPATTGMHYKDTLDGGWHINNYAMVRAFTEEMPARIYDLEEYGVMFDREADGEFYVWKGGKQSEPLNVCVGDYTGREMMQGLVDELRKLSIPYIDEFFVTKIFRNKDGVGGALGFDLATGEYTFFRTKVVILAAGGAGRMYEVTTNAASNSGDGFAMALDLGVELIDMEMTQFHPTGMVFPDSARGVLVTEKVRGHGGHLKNKNGERFMARYQPKLMELAGRDEVARAIYQEVAEGRGTEHGGVYLDVTHWPKSEIEEKIPDVFEQYMVTGVDIRKTPMEIYPSMHHMCGGVRITVDGETNLPGLLAVGEVAGGVHGANRLGGNSIAEGQVFGKRSITAAKKEVMDRKHFFEIPAADIEAEIERVEGFSKRKSGNDTYVLEHELKKLMWDNVGIIREEKLLQKAKKRLAELRKEAVKVKISTGKRPRNKELQDALELQNMIYTAQAVVDACLLRRESRGAHFRSDYPEMQPEWRKNVVVTADKGKIKVTTAPVREKEEYEPSV